MVTCVRDIRLRILVLMLLLTALDLASHNGLSQDVVLMEEAVWANADCYRNYDASFESTVLAEVPKDPLELSRLVEKLEARGRTCLPRSFFSLVGFALRIHLATEVLVGTSDQNRLSVLGSSL